MYRVLQPQIKLISGRGVKMPPLRMDAGGLELIALTAPHTESILQGVHAPCRNKIGGFETRAKVVNNDLTGAIFGEGGE
jgi:hypothetical protein